MPSLTCTDLHTTKKAMRMVEQIPQVIFCLFAVRAWKLQKLRLAQKREGLGGETQDPSLPPSLPSQPPLVFPHSSSSGIVPCTSPSQPSPCSFPERAQSLPQKKFALLKAGTSEGLLAPLLEANGILSLAKRFRHSGLQLRPSIAGINPKAALELLIFISGSNLSLASSTRDQV